MAQAVENFCKVTPGFTLDNYGDREEFEVFAVYPLRHISQGFRHSDPEIDLIEGLAEFGAHRVSEFLGHHSQSAGKSMAGLERPGDKFEGFGELPLEFFHPFFSLMCKVEKRGHCQKD